MSKKLMLLAAGALSALAFAALPAIASAEELEVHCPTAPCIASISGTNVEHAIELEADNGDKIDATAVDGSVKITTATTKTATTEIEFTHVFETVSGFKFTCKSPGAPEGVIRTGALVTHFINYLPSPNTLPAVLLTNANVTFTCAGFLTKTVTGNIIGTILEPAVVCNKATATYKVTFNKKPGTPGTQEHELWTGNPVDLTSGTQASDGTTSAQTGHGNITWEAANKPTLTCP